MIKKQTNLLKKGFWVFIWSLVGFYFFSQRHSTQSTFRNEFSIVSLKAKASNKENFQLKQIERQFDINTSKLEVANVSSEAPLLESSETLSQLPKRIERPSPPTRNRTHLGKWDMSSSFGSWDTDLKHQNGTVTMITRIAGNRARTIENFGVKYRSHLCSRELACDNDPTCKTFAVAKTCVSGRDYPPRWHSAMSRYPVENEIYYTKWRVTNTILSQLPEDEWVFFTDLDTTVLNKDRSLGEFTALAGNHSVLLVDRPLGLPNAGCFMVKNNDIGRRFVQFVLSIYKLPLFQEDNGAMALAILHLFDFEYTVPKDPRAVVEYYHNFMRSKGLDFESRRNQGHPHVRFFNHQEESGPFCVRPQERRFRRATEPTTHIASGPTDPVLTSYMVHSKSQVKSFEETNREGQCNAFLAKLRSQSGQFCGSN